MIGGNNMKKLIKIVLFFGLLLTFTACSSDKLSSSFDKDEVTDKAKAVVEVINTKDYAAIIALFRSDLQDQITADQLQQAFDEQLEAAGTFSDFKSIVIKSENDNSTNEEYAVVILEAVYENKTLIYTISFDTDLELVGLYMK